MASDLNPQFTFDFPLCFLPANNSLQHFLFLTKDSYRIRNEIILNFKKKMKRMRIHRIIKQMHSIVFDCCAEITCIIERREKDAGFLNL